MQDKMIFPNTPQRMGKEEGGFHELPSSPSCDKILVAQDTLHVGAGHGLLANGGKKSVGNYIIEFVNNGSQFATVQIWQCAIGVKPKVQSWNRTKTVVQKKTVIKEVVKKPTTTIKEFINKGVEEF